jgi:hypothetical protein
VLATRIEIDRTFASARTAARPTEETA